MTPMHSSNYSMLKLKSHQMKMMLCNLQCVIFFAIFFHTFSSLDAKTLNPTNQSLSKLITSTITNTIFQAHDSYNNLKKGATLMGGNIDMLSLNALKVCDELLQLSITHLNNSISRLNDDPNGVQDVQALLSGASTNPYTCLNGLEQGKHKSPIVYNQYKERLMNITNQIYYTLELVSKLPGAWKPLNPASSFSSSSSSGSDYVYPLNDDGYPAWMDDEDRTMLLKTNTRKIKKKNNYVVVAKDGSGNFRTIKEALNAAPSDGNGKFIIRIKAGIYYENLVVAKKNIMLVGDGMKKTFIKGRNSVGDGVPMSMTAVLAVTGEGFIAKELTIENYAGPSKSQAIALRTDGDKSAFYHVKIMGYQDTLFANTLRQFFRECDIHGTIDFICGNAAVVFQKCNFHARKPLSYQQIVFTAHARDNYYQTTGFSIMESNFNADHDLINVKNQYKSYLGRPWGEYSRTIVINSYIGDLIDSVGWMEWEGTRGLSTLYYGEYLNRGPGANTGGRVRWGGHKVITDWREAAQYTVGAFIQGREWIMSGIPHYDNLPGN